MFLFVKRKIFDRNKIFYGIHNFLNLDLKILNKLNLYSEVKYNRDARDFLKLDRDELTYIF